MQRDSKAWLDMVHSTSQGGEALEASPHGKPEKMHVRAVLSAMHSGWASLRKVLAAQARAAGMAAAAEEYSLGFDAFAAAVDEAGVLATRMQLQAVFALVDAEACGIVTLGEIVECLRRGGFRVRGFRGAEPASETGKVPEAVARFVRVCVGPISA